MKVLVYFPRKREDVYFEGAMLENKIRKACKSVDVTDKFSRDVDIANFINLHTKSIKVIHQAISHSVPTLLWMFFANNDHNARVIETKKDNSLYIPPARLDIINMMDGVVVPTNEAKVILRRLGVKIPLFVVYGAVKINRMQVLEKSADNIFERYFRINAGQKYAFSVMNIKAKSELEELNLLAAAVPDYHFYAFLSTSISLVDRIKLSTYKKQMEKNLTISQLVPEDIYRAGLINARYFIDLGVEKMNVLTLYEVMHVKVPIIMHKKAAFKEIIDENSAFIVNDFSGAAYVMRNELDPWQKTERAFSYTTKVTEAAFTEAIFKLFKKIYTR